MAELTDVTDVVAEVAEEVADHAESAAKVSRSLTQQELSLGLGGLLLGIGVGLTVGYQVAKRRLHQRYYDEAMQIAEFEIEEIKKHYRAKEKAAEKKPPLDNVVEQLGYKEPEMPQAMKETIAAREAREAREREMKAIEETNAKIAEEEVVEEIKNVFEAEEDFVWDYQREVKARDPEVPYVIHVDEYMAGEKDYTQVTLTYFEEDDVLADERDGVIEDQDELICLGNLLRFGHGSNDPNIVYVRNDEKAIDFEICRSQGSYAKEVHGFLEHSFDQPRRRGHPRFDDE